MEKVLRHKRYAIMGAAGKIGCSATKFLLARDCEVRVIGRSSSKLGKLTDSGAVPFIGDIQDASFLQTAFAGVDGVLAMIPGWEQQKAIRQYLNDLGVSIFTACLISKVPRVVNISDYSVQFISSAEYLLGMKDQEFRLNNLPETHVIHLRPAFFLPNFCRALHETVFASTGSSNAPLLKEPMAEEIGETAARFLYDARFSEKGIVELSGADG